MSRALALCLLLTSCFYDTTYIVVDVDASAVSGGLTQLDCAATLPTGVVHVIDTKAAKIGATTSFTIQTSPDVKGITSLAVYGVDMMQVVASGTTTANVTGKGVVRTSVKLAPITAEPVHCVSGMKDADETDVDCGGSCPPCDAFQGCAVNADCLTSACVNAMQCAPASGPPNWLAGPTMQADTKSGAISAATSGDAIYVLSAFSATAVVLQKVLTLQTGPTPFWGLGGATPDDNVYGTTGVDATGLLYRLGGQDSSGAVSTAYSYDSSTMKFTAVAVLPTAVERMPAVLGPDSKVYVVGGSTGASVTVDVQAFTPGSPGSWAQAAQLFTAVQFNTVALGVDDRLYSIGGQPGGGKTAVADVYSFGPLAVPVESVWVGAPTLSTARSSACAASGSDGRIWVTGGDNGANPPTVFGSVEALDPTVGAWTGAPHLSTARTYHACATGSDGRLYVIGGYDPSGNDLASVEVYGPILSVTQTSPITPNSTVAISGSNFAANAKVTLTLSSTGTPNVANLITDSTGTLVDATGSTSGVTVGIAADTAPGTYRLEAVDSRSRFAAYASINVVSN